MRRLADAVINIQDKFNEARVEIMLPAYSALRDGSPIAISGSYLITDYETLVRDARLSVFVRQLPRCRTARPNKGRLMNDTASVIRLRRSLLYVPGDREAMIAKAAQRGADGLILNLEDAVAPGNKELARNVVAHALSAPDFGRAEVIVRVNPLDTLTGYRDLLAIAPVRPDAILLPKVSSPEEVRFAAWTVARLEEMHDLPAGGVRLMCMIESAAGVLAAAQIAGCHPRVAALLFGAADYSAEVGCAITPDGDTLLYAQSRIVLASRAAGIDAIDTPHMRLDDPEGLARSSQRAHQLGFNGKSAIHPGQIGSINSAFSPTLEQIAWAERVLAALPSGDGASMGAPQLGAAVLDGQLIEAPHLARARRILSLQAQIAAQ